MIWGPGSSVDLCRSENENEDECDFSPREVWCFVYVTCFQGKKSSYDCNHAVYG